MRVIFFGTPPFAAEALKQLIENNVNVAAVITKPDKAQGRSAALQPTPVKLMAAHYQLPLYQPEIVSDPTFFPLLEEIKPDLYVVVAYGEIIKQQVLNLPRLGAINLHASLLPGYRGAAPIQRAIINGEKKSGVSIMFMVKKMDAGDVIETVNVEITADMTFGELENKLCEVGCPLLVEVVKRYETGPLISYKQDEEKVTFASKIELEECELLWNKPATTLHNLIRGTNPHPGAWCWINYLGKIKRLKVWKSSIFSSEILAPPGYIIGQKNRLIVACSSGALQLLEVQLEGKKKMSGEEFLRGIANQDSHQLSFVDTAS